MMIVRDLCDVRNAVVQTVWDISQRRKFTFTLSLTVCAVVNTFFEKRNSNYEKCGF